MQRPDDLPDEKLLADINEVHRTISGRIRALAEAGWPTARIAEALSILYQHAYNVLKAAGVNPSDISKMVKDVENATAGLNLSDISERTNAAKNAMAQLSGIKECDYRYLQDALTQAPEAGKKSVNLSINASLLAAAKLSNINLSETLENSLTTLLSQQARERWQAENQEAIAAHNQFVERHGLWSDGLRQF